MKQGYIYMITNPFGKIYIGSTHNIEKRWRHYKTLGCKRQTKLYNSLKKYGIENHVFEVIMQTNIDEILKYETLIGWGFDVLDQHKGLNCVLPKLGEIHSCMGDESKLKVSKANKGKKRTIEFKERMKLITTGKKHSKESIEKRKQALIGNKSKLGQKIPLDVVRKSSLGHMITITQYNLDGSFIKEWESATTASKYLNLNKCSIRLCCRGILKTSGGFIWKQNQPKPN